MADIKDGSVEHYQALLSRATQELKRLRQELAGLQDSLYEPIAIVGMACRFPGGVHSLPTFWQLLADGRDAITNTDSRWRDTWPAFDRNKLPRSARWAGLLDDVAGFDAEFFAISPREARKMDPQQRLLLQVAWEALEQAGCTLENLTNSKTAVFVGEMVHDYEHSLLAAGEQSDAYAVTGTMLTFAAGRLSYLLGLQGPCLALDTACSSSLVGVHLAAQSLRLRETDLALVGASNLVLSPVVMDMMAQTQALSPDGRCRAFDARANGYVRGEGCGVLVLKRLSDAQRDHDPIYALVRGSAVNQDGPSSGLTAPNAMAQVALLKAALANADLGPEHVGYIEAHGTGTPLGDPIEMQALRDVFGTPRPDGSKLPVGSVKTNIGHLEAAAGMASIFKVVLALQQQLIPRHLHFETLNPMINLANTPFVIPAEPRPWPSGDQPRIAGVSAFAMSGTNAHVLIEEAPARPSPSVSKEQPRMLPLSARSPEALQAIARRYEEYLRKTTDTAESIAYTAGVNRTHHPHRLAVVGNGPDDWREALTAAALGQSHPRIISAGSEASVAQRRVVFMFSGQGAQWLGMGRELLDQDPVFGAAFAECDAAIQAFAGGSVIDALRSDDPTRLQRIDVVQPALFAMQVALTAVWRAWGVEPAAVVGHSMGEVAAAYVSGALDLRDAVRVICLRSQLMRQVAGRGAMLSVDTTAATARAWVEASAGKLCLAVLNGENANVLAGDVESIDALQTRLTAEGIFCARVKTDVAFHSPHMDALCADLASGLAGMTAQRSTLPLVSTVKGGPMEDTLHDAAYWVRNLRQPVLFADAMAHLVGTGHRLFIEISPHPVLVPAIAPVVRGKGHAVASLRREQPERATLLAGLAKLYAHGLRLDFKKQFVGFPGRASLPTYAWQERRHWAPVPDAWPGAQATLGDGPQPLLGSPLELSTGDRAWNAILTNTSPPYWEEHQVAGAVVVPASGFVEMMLEAAQQVFPGMVVSLNSLTLKEPLVLAPETRHVVQVMLSEQSAGGGRVRISSRTGDQWLLHATAELVAEAAAPRAGKRQTLPTDFPLPGEELYRRLAVIGLVYGPMFQRIEAAAVSSEAAWGRLHPWSPTAGYALHPALLDGALHAAALQTGGGGALRGPWVPIQIETVRVLGDPTLARFTQAVRNGKQPANPDAWHGHVRMLSQTGEVLVEVLGLELRQVGTAAQTPSIFWEHQWQLATVNAPHGNRASGSWLVLADARHGLGAALQHALTEFGATVDFIPWTPNWEQPLAEALASGRPYRGIFHLWSLDAPDVDVPELDLQALQAPCCDSVVALVRLMSRLALRDPPRLWLVSAGAQRIASDPPSPAVVQAAVWGLGRTIAYEHPELRCARVDVLPAAGTGGLQEMAGALAAEAVADNSDDEILLRPGGRYVGRVMRIDGPAPSLPAPSCRADGTYLVSGGLGGLGLSVARWLAEHGAKEIVLLGRHGITTPEQRAAVDALAQHGARVQVVCADVADSASLNAALTPVLQGAKPVRGVVHAAGIVEDSVLTEQSPERFARVLAPKVLGAVHLHRLTAREPVEFFVLYGSAAALLGSAGQGNYAAGNAFLDALASWRRAGGLPAVSISWGPFSETGMAAATQARGGRLAQRGMQSISPEEGLQVLEQLLGSDVVNIGVIKLNARQWLDSHPQLGASGLFAEMHRGATNEAGQTIAGTPLRARVTQAPVDKRQEFVEDLVCEQIAKVLGMEARRIGRDAPLKSLGVDSLISLELRNQLEAAFQVHLSATMIWSHPNVAALGRFILQELHLDAAETPTILRGSGTVDVEESSTKLANLSEEALIETLQKELA